MIIKKIRMKRIPWKKESIKLTLDMWDDVYFSSFQLVIRFKNKKIKKFTVISTDGYIRSIITKRHVYDILENIPESILSVMLSEDGEAMQALKNILK